MCKAAEASLRRDNHDSVEFDERRNLQSPRLLVWFRCLRVVGLASLHAKPVFDLDPATQETVVSRCSKKADSLSIGTGILYSNDLEQYRASVTEADCTLSIEIARQWHLKPSLLQYDLVV